MRVSHQPDRKSRCIRRTSRRFRERGNTVMELVFFLFPTLAIICGFLDIGMALFVWNTLQNAVREGTRYAITYQVDSNGTQIRSVQDTVASWSMNLVQATTTSGNPGYIAVTFYTPPTPTNPSGTLVTGANSNAPGNIVQVSVPNFPYKWMAPFSGTFWGGFYASPGSSFGISVVSADVLGGAPVTGVPSP